MFLFFVFGGLKAILKSHVYNVEKKINEGRTYLVSCITKKEKWLYSKESNLFFSSFSRRCVIINFFEMFNILCNWSMTHTKWYRLVTFTNDLSLLGGPLKYLIIKNLYLFKNTFFFTSFKVERPSIARKQQLISLTYS